MNQLCQLEHYSYLATAEPEGIESGAIGVTAALTSTVPSTNGANPAKNLHKTLQFIFY